MVNKMFAEKVDVKIEVYIEDILVKSLIVDHSSKGMLPYLQ